MTNKIVASAPGKVVLSGEYAVLDGAPAICMAIERRALVVMTVIDDEFSTVRAAAYTDEIGRFRAADGVLHWQHGREIFAIVDSVSRIADVTLASLNIDLDSSEFIDAATGQKIGIGSSAAITVALMAAATGTVDSAKIAILAQRAHADLQGGVGSGVDIACSLNGGLIEYRIEGASVAALTWPEGLHYRLVWTGRAASTRDKLSKLDTAISKPSRVRLAGASERMALAWRSFDAARIISEYRFYNESLLEFSVDHDLGILDAGHAELQQAASADNLVYKPCGAGGGDIGIVFGTNELQLDTFAKRLASRFTVLDWRLSETGAVIEEATT